ncbi:MAG: phosphodiester glycosidase family protein [Planctomycetota bacterium]
MAAAAGVQAQPIAVQELDLTGRGGPVRAFLATIDLNDPSIEIVVTSGTAGGNNAIVPLVRTDTWAQSEGVDLAINANYFGNLGNGSGQLLGLSVSDGVIVSNPRIFDGRYDPALAITGAGTAFAGYLSPSQLATAREGIAGIGRSSTDGLDGSMLVDDGVNLGNSARVSPSTREPRTAAGVSQDGRTLYLLVVDGRQPGYSVGVNLFQLAEVLIDAGAWDAINLDGGGSSSFWYQPEGGSLLTNSPSDGAFRPVAAHLGVRGASVPQPGSYRDGNPVRGVWLRPPTDPSQFDALCDTFAQAGITDIYLETLYWGLAGNLSTVFQRRYGFFDYLRYAINTAAARGIRVHAWLETGYISFSGSGDYLFDEDPDRKVVNIQDPATTGDIAGQAFWNLGNPGVQQKLSEYATELGEIEGLRGVHIDYHRFPVGPSGQAPYSYDAWARAEFQSQFGVDPAVSASAPGTPFWNQWLQFRRDGISECANVMHQSMAAADPGLNFSAAIFATATTSSSQLSKCQDWPTWAANGYIETIIPMAYGFSTTSIRNDIQTTLNLSSDVPVVAGLAILTNATRPSITAQLDTIQERGVEDFVLFDGATLAGVSTYPAELAAWISSNAELLREDLDNNHVLDATDRSLFYAGWSGSADPTSISNVRLDLDDSGTVDAADAALFDQAFIRWRFGEDGVVDEKDLNALLRARSDAAGIPGPRLHLFDLDGDGDVDLDDETILNGFATAPLPPAFDANEDDKVDVIDLYYQGDTPRDVNRDGRVDAQDFRDLETKVREFEFFRMSIPQIGP